MLNLIKKVKRDISVNNRPKEIIPSYVVGDYIQNLGEDDETILRRLKLENELSRRIRGVSISVSIEERFQDIKKIMEENPEYGIIERVFDNSHDETLVGETLPRPLICRIFPFLNKDLPKEKINQRIITNFRSLELKGQSIHYFHGTSLYGWRELSHGVREINRTRRISEETAFKHLERKIKELGDQVDMARNNPEEIYRILHGPYEGDYSPFIFSNENELRKQQLKLIGCIQAAKQFRLREVYETLKSSSTIEERLDANLVNSRPGTNYFVVINNVSCLEKTAPPVVIYANGYDNSKLDNYEYETSNEIQSRFPRLFDIDKPLPAYNVIEIPSEALDLVNKAYEMKFVPLRDFEMITVSYCKSSNQKRIS